ncbi:MAG: hypothetical protein A2176_00500 [Spirochaetes bacterium RBG_13_51_14]|nr:MAG: hypothetical protein A2176_00500 [Spirochaetes bacterium RBG_13_51_14]
MKRSPDLYLEDIIEAIKSVFIFVEGMELGDFNNDDKTASAVIRKLEVIGEAAKNMPGDITNRHDGIPWSYMAKMRDKLIHGYPLCQHSCRAPRGRVD